jgi:(R,R)-butanediol dehydrogenase/meso-butanediol dehydrogenase/diacetyl reductase
MRAVSGAGMMRAAFFEAARSIVIREAPIPEPSPDEVRLRVGFCGICGSDVSLYKTGALAGPNVVLGHEVSATVDLDRSSRLAAGTRVVPFPARGCGECAWCLAGDWRHCLNPGTLWGGFAEYTVYPARNLIAVPDALDDRAAALAEPLGVALRGVELSGVADGDLAYVSGLGSIGLFTVAGLLAAGCRVVGADPNPKRRAAAEALGVEATFDNTTENAVARMEEFDPRGPRVAFECAGVPDSLQEVFEVCGALGTVGILGIPMAPVLLLRMTIKEQRAFSISGPSMDSMRHAIELLVERPQIGDVVTGWVGLKGLDAAIADLAGGRGGIKVLVDPRG